MKILVVDDEQSVRRHLENYLIQEGHEVESLGDSREAVKVIQAETFDLIILDLMMPYFDGFELLKTAHQAGITTPAIIMTAGAREVENIRPPSEYPNGPQAYLGKPIDENELLEKAKTVLETRVNNAD